ncbi:winged helix DNA-binding domain-containing protein [Nocardioides marmotae]|uniref:winged helix DNA-binding domain-containing protein n=1 Tax=Nocardioides marmotae TaxID=2663857 RepID=UPI001321DA34|nr:winged helix DNA-binding domain-containing protein [Nocardioides marmotae]MBC9734678.1 AlkZ family DNA glycosylase [Nocardioides marmotae]MTB85780.1 winged helix DNA-binding domain-containing protein [Nocardioides marmotae]
MRCVTDDERRARLALRHGLAPTARVADAEAATAAMTVLHATEPATPYLSVWARVDGFARADLDRALEADRALVKQLAMRRTLFVLPRDLLPAAWGSASARVAATERARVVKDVVLEGLATDGEAWLAANRADVLALLAEHPAGLTAAELRAAVPALGGSLFTGRLLTGLGAEARVVRGTNTQHWRVSRPRWTLMEHWLGEVPAPLPPAEGYAALVRRWLWSFGPGTEADLVWWLGATKGAVRAALADLGAVRVGLDGGGTGWLLPEDEEPVAAPEDWAALLPVLDATVMGWKERAWYLGPHAPALFDRNGNAGTTAWWNGRAVGCWTQDPAGTVHVRLVEDVPVAARALLDHEAARLTAWLAGERVGTVYPSPAMKERP